MQEGQFSENTDGQEVSRFKDTLLRYTKKWPWMLICVIISITICFLNLKRKPNRYRVESKVFIKKSQQLSDPNELLFGGRNSFRGTSRVNDEAIMFKSFPLIRSTLIDLNFDVTYRKKEGLRTLELYKKSPIIIDFDRKLNKKIPLGTKLEIKPSGVNEFSIATIAEFEGESLNGIYKYNEQIKLGGFSFKIRKNKEVTVNLMAEDEYTISFNSLDAISYSYKGRLKFDEVKGMSSILTMSMNTAVPEKSIDFINTLIRKYTEQNLEEKNKAGKNTVAFIDNQILMITDSLNNKEINLADFKSSEQMSDLSIEGKMLVEKFSQIETEKANYEVRQQYYDYLQGNLKDKDQSNLKNLIAPSAFGIEDLIINDLVKSLIDLNLSKANLIQNGNTKSPLITQIDSRSKQLIKTLEESIDNLTKANKIILNALDVRSKGISTSVEKLPNSERKLVSLNRLLKLNENIYLFLMEKRSSAAISMSSNIPDCKVIEPAMLNPLSPISPNRRMAFMIAILMGFFLPLMFFVLLDVLNDTIRDKEEVESLTRVPIMGTVPRANNFDSKMVIAERPKSAIAESFRIIRTNLSFFQAKKTPFVILLTSSVSSEGKTYNALNLASILAASGKKTVLLGFDLRKPQLHNYLNMENEIGISNYISGNISLQEIVKPTKMNDLFIINAGPTPPNPAELLLGDKTKELIRELKNDFDYIIMDTPPVGLVTDALILKEEADLNLFVIRQDYSKRSFIDNLNDLHVKKGMKNLSILINDVPVKGNYGYYEEELSYKDRLINKIKKA
jgi:capsular exopolysaccharide synthesis family protein